MKRKITLLTALVLVIGLCVTLSACGGIKSVTLSTNTCEIVADETYQLSYSVLPEDADTDELIWASADENVVTVDAKGEITAVSAGQTTITIANGEEVLASCSVTVTQKPAYERLSEEEKAFVDCFLAEVNAFKKPDSVKVEGITLIPADDIGDFWVVKVSAENSFGDTNSEAYYLAPSMGFSEAPIFTLHDAAYDLGLINEAIAEKR